MDYNLYSICCKIQVGDDLIVVNDEIFASSPIRAFTKFDDMLVENYIDFRYIGFSVVLA